MQAGTAQWLAMENGLPVLTTARLILRIAEPNEEPMIVDYLRRNRDHLQPWEPKRDEAYFTEVAWFGAPERDRAEALEGKAYRFRLISLPLVAEGVDSRHGVGGPHPSPKSSPRETSFADPRSQRERVADKYIGTVSLRDINPWPGLNATIGYSMDHEWEGRGLMREAVAAVVRFGFEHLGLRRIEACFMPANVKSERLLTSLGFEVEGRLRSSLEVNGVWEDHKICSLINQNWRRA
jgi:ribosomal-protein-alanine N-acetyltransferase